MKTGITRIVGLFVLSLLAAAVWSYPLLTNAHPGDTEAIDGIAGRTNLQLCVANSDGYAVNATTLTAVQSAFARLQKNSLFTRAGLGGGSGPQLLAGCPSRSTLKKSDWGGHLVTKPGPIHTYVFIASAAELAGVSFKAYPRVTGQERMCGGGKCWSVANAVYITPQELNSPDELLRAMIAGVGLEQDSSPIYVNGVTHDNRSK